MTASPEITMQGYLTEGKLAAALKELLADQWLGSQISVGGTRQRWDMSCRLGGVTCVVEYDGDEHYRHSIKIKADRAKDAAARAAEYRVVRFPYWIQLDTVTLQHFFGISAIVHQSFPHGFITTKLFPASFCELGIARFYRVWLGIASSIRSVSAFPNTASNTSCRLAWLISSRKIKAEFPRAWLSLAVISCRSRPNANENYDRPSRPSSDLVGRLRYPRRTA